MTFPYPPPSTSRRQMLTLLRDSAAVALLLVGLVMALWILFTIDVKAGLLGLSVLMVGAGVALGYRPAPPR